MSTRVSANNPGKNMLESLPTSGSLPSGSANHFIFGAGLGLQALRRTSTTMSTSTSTSTSSSEFSSQILPPPLLRPHPCGPVRCLFGSPDPKSGQFARERVREIQEQEKVKWDYDFVNDRPVDGPKRFIWEAVPVKRGSSYFSTTESAGKQSSTFVPDSSNATITSSSGSISKSSSSAARAESDSLLIVRSVSGSSSTSPSSPTCPPPPCKQSSPERRSSLTCSPTPPEREHHLQLGPVNVHPAQRVNFTHFSSSSSQSSPEILEDVRHLHVVGGLPSPPSSLEEDNCNSRPCSPVEVENSDTLEPVSGIMTTSTTSTSGRATTATRISSPTTQSKITDFMAARKRRAGSNATTTSTSTGTTSGCGSPPPEKKTAL